LGGILIALSFWLGGAVAFGVVSIAGALESGEPIEADELVQVLLWPATVALFLAAQLRARP